MNKVLLLIFTSLLVSVSCTKQPSASIQVDNTDASSTLDWTPLAFDCLVLKSKIDLKSKDNNVHVTANIRIKKDSIIWVSMTPGMGIEIIRSIITPDSVKIINRLDNKYDKYSISYLKETLGIDLNFYNLQNLLVGDLLLPLKPQDLIQDDTLKGTWEVLQKSLVMTSTSTVDKSQKKVRRLYAENQNQKSIKAEYDDFTIADSTLFHQTQKLVLVSNKDSSFIEANHQKIDFTSKDISFPFSVPKKYEK
jgi:hypothetical protein